MDNILRSTGEALLEGAGTVSHAQALEKAKREYRKYQVQTISPVEAAYLQTIKNVEKKPERKRRNRKHKEQTAADEKKYPVLGKI